MNAKDESQRKRRMGMSLSIGLAAAMLAVFLPAANADGGTCQQEAAMLVNVDDTNALDCVPDGSADDADFTGVCTPYEEWDGNLIGQNALPTPVTVGAICVGSHTLFTSTGTEEKASGDSSEFHCGGQHWYGSYQWDVKLEITPTSNDASGSATGSVSCDGAKAPECSVSLGGTELSCNDGPKDTNKGGGSCDIQIGAGSISFKVHLKCEDPPVVNGEAPGLLIEKVYDVDPTGAVSLVSSTIQELLP